MPTVQTTVESVLVDKKKTVTGHDHFVVITTLFSTNYFQSTKINVLFSTRNKLHFLFLSISNCKARFYSYRIVGWSVKYFKRLGPAIGAFYIVMLIILVFMFFKINIILEACMHSNLYHRKIWSICGFNKYQTGENNLFSTIFNTKFARLKNWYAITCS